MILENKSIQSVYDNQFNWNVGCVPVYTRDSEHNFVEIPNRYSVQRLDNSYDFEVVKSRYVPVQNEEVFNFINDLGFDQLEHAYIMKNGARNVVLASAGAGLEVKANDIVHPYFMFSWSHDSSSSLNVGFIMERMVCTNMMQQIMSNKSNRIIKIRHTSSVHDTLDSLRESILEQGSDFENNVRVLRELANKSISTKELENYINKCLNLSVFPEDYKGRDRTIQENKRNEVINLFSHGKGNEGQTWFDAYNGITEYVTHHMGTEKSRNESMFFGQGKVITKKALELALVA